MTQEYNLPRLDRRDLLKGAAAVGLATVLDPLAGALAAPTPRKSDLIHAENDKPGTTDWLLRNTRVDPKTKYRCPWIEGYCSHTSLRAGDALEILVSTNPPSSFVIDLYRLGYYQGKGGRHLLRLGPFKGKVQPDPEVGEERLRECRWEPATKVVIPKDWPSGVYLGKLTAENEGLQSYVVFIVRDDRACDFLFQCSDTTWSAYNRWPSQWSLYDDGKKQWYWGPGVRVSWDRPYGKYCQILDAPLSQGSGEFLLWEFPLAFWMEKEGYDVSYISNVDTHADSEGLRRAKAWLSVGHDEYWSLDMLLWRDPVPAQRPRSSQSSHQPHRPIRSHPGSRRQGRLPGTNGIAAQWAERSHPDRRAQHIPSHRRSGLDLRKRKALAVRRHRHEERRWHPRARGLGVARRPGGYFGS